MHQFLFLPAKRALPVAPPPRCEARRGPLRLLHVFPTFGIGGAQVRFATLVGGFGAGVCHSVLALAGDYEAADIVPAGPDVFYLSPPPRSSTAARLLAYRRIIDKVDPDVLLTYNWGSMEFALVNSLSGRPHLHLEDGFGPDEAAGQLRRRIWGRRVALRHSHILVPSETLCKLALESWGVSPERLHHVPNGVPAADTAPSAALGLDLPVDRVRIAWTGALRPEKNPVRLLHAFAPLRDRATLVVIGDGPERGAVTAAARTLGLGDSVRLLGRRRDARDVITQCDVLALSSDTEQMPLVVLEAMAAGLPVASFDVGDVRLMVAPANRPFVVPPSTEALSSALGRLVDDPCLRRAVGAANQARAAEVYDARTMVRAHRTLIEELAGRAS